MPNFPGCNYHLGENPYEKFSTAELTNADLLIRKATKFFTPCNDHFFDRGKAFSHVLSCDICRGHIAASETRKVSRGVTGGVSPVHPDAR